MEIKQLSETEQQVMEIIWDKEPPVSRSEIEKELCKDKELAPSTIITFLTRLCDKGFLSLSKQGRTNLYSPLISRDEYLRIVSKSFLSRFFKGSFSDFAVAFCGNRIDEDDMEELRKLLEENKL